MTAHKLIKELDTALSGKPWYGSSVVKLIEQVDPEKVQLRPSGPHSSSDILLHMIAWTEETTERLNGKFAADPARDDWPDSSGFTWTELTRMFLLSNEQLKDTIVKMDESRFFKIVNDDRDPEEAELITYKELIRGLIQHHIYHSAQIALLNK
jgi:uncharacterized damage-inducible protein DinB